MTTPLAPPPPYRPFFHNHPPKKEPPLSDPSPSVARLRVARIERSPSPEGYATVRVGLDLRGERHTGESQGVLTREGDLRSGAEATLRAVASATAGKIRFSLLGIKAVRAFDSWIVITSVDARADDQHYKLIGARTVQAEDMVHGAVLSVLDALNRVVELHLP